MASENLQQDLRSHVVNLTNLMHVSSKVQEENL
jgi:hypothetical protein